MQAWMAEITNAFRQEHYILLMIVIFTPSVCMLLGPLVVDVNVQRAEGFLMHQNYIP